MYRYHVRLGVKSTLLGKQEVIIIFYFLSESNLVCKTTSVRFKVAKRTRLKEWRGQFNCQNYNLLKTENSSAFP